MTLEVGNKNVVVGLLAVMLYLCMSFFINIPPAPWVPSCIH